MGRFVRTRQTSAGIVVILAFTVMAAARSAVAGTVGSGTEAVVAATSAPQGGTVTIAGNISPSAACPPSAPVQLTSTPTSGTDNLFPNGVGPKVPRDDSGNFQATFVVPATTPVGTYTIGVLCGNTTAGATDTLSVTAAARPSVTVSPTSVNAGGMVTISGLVPLGGSVSCPAGDAAQLTSTAGLFPPDGFGPQAARDPAGAFRTTYTIPSSTAAGSYSIGVRCGGGNVGVSASLQVAAAKATTTTTVTTASSTTVPSVTTTAAATTTTLPVTTLPAVTTTTRPSTVAKSRGRNNALRWTALGVILIVVLALAALLLGRRR